MSVANINAGFVAIVGSSQHQEAKARQFLAIADVKTLLVAHRNSTSGNFVLTTDDRQNRLTIAIPRCTNFSTNQTLACCSLVAEGFIAPC